MENKTLDVIIEEVMGLLKNKSGMYHGWFTLTTDKYGGWLYSAWACLNPPDDREDLNRTKAPHFEGETPNEAMTKLLNWLIEWDKNGREYKKFPWRIEDED